jgi:phospholipase/lecithinase/hemolysin
MRNQVLDFAQRVRSGAIRFNPQTTIFFLLGGLNDSALTTTMTIANLKDEIRELHDAGGRYFLVALLPTRIPSFSEVGIRLNPALAKIPDELRSTLPRAHVGVSQWGRYYDSVMENPARYGILNTTNQCAGRAIFGEDPTPCSAPDTHFYFHDSHPSAAVHRIVAAELEREITDEGRSIWAQQRKGVL